MSKRESEEYKITKLNTFAYGLANFADNSATQFFNFLLFTFYYAIVGININLLTIGYIIFSIWNAINDPLVGAWSDKTQTKWGRRKPFIIAGIIPTSILLVLLWIPPTDSELISFTYFLILVLIYDTFYTMFYVNQMSLFPEMYQELEERAKANIILQIFTILALIIAFILPSFFIPKYEDKRYFINYRYAGLAISIIFLVSGLIFIKFGIKERMEFSKDPEKAPPFLKALKYSLKNKAFITYIIANFSTYYVLGIYTTITPLYGSFALGINNSFLLSLLLGASFISAALFVPIWQKLSVKFGVKNAMIIALTSTIIITVPFLFIEGFGLGIIFYFLAGFSLAGMIFLRRLTLAAVIDDDELKTLVRREASYYGVDALIVKLSTIFIFLSISFVFNSVGWAIFDPKGTTEQTIFGLRLLMWLFPTIALIIGILSMLNFPIGKEEYNIITKEAKKLHEEKKAQLEK
ncbi:MAG: MFS transporter [Promethearchaeota archaeon]